MDDEPLLTVWLLISYYQIVELGMTSNFIMTSFRFGKYLIPGFMPPFELL